MLKNSDIKHNNSFDQKMVDANVFSNLDPTIVNILTGLIIFHMIVFLLLCCLFTRDSLKESKFIFKDKYIEIAQKAIEEKEKAKYSNQKKWDLEV